MSAELWQFCGIAFGWLVIALFAYIGVRGLSQVLREKWDFIYKNKASKEAEFWVPELVQAYKSYQNSRFIRVPLTMLALCWFCIKAVVETIWAAGVWFLIFFVCLFFLYAVLTGIYGL